jgi:hypothetical protein
MIRFSIPAVARARNKCPVIESVLFDAASAPNPTGASGKSATTAPDNLFNIEFDGWSGVETFLDLRLQPGELLAAAHLEAQRRCKFAPFSPPSNIRAKN